MNRLLIDRFGVRGNELPARPEWICSECLPRFKLKDPFYREKAWREAERADEERKHHDEGKKRWADEQERRRLANLVRKEP
jgi:hypothetical protein